MTGWIKLWRKLKKNGHLKMPGTAFKLWIYCLLEATNLPDRSRDLEAGELWLNYEHVRQVISETGRQMSKSTVSNGLKYLKQNGYINLETKQFYGVKVKITNWREYQSPGTKSVPGKASRLTENESIKEIKADLNLDLDYDFQKEFGRKLSHSETKRLASWREEFSSELIKEAMARAVTKNKLSIAYIEGILESWRQKGVTSVEEAKQERIKRRKSKKPEATDEKEKELIKSLYLS